MKRYEIGTNVFTNWTITKSLGEGSFGKVFEIEREDFGEVYRSALKIIRVPQNPAEIQNAYDEGMSEQQVRQYFYAVVEDIVREFSIMSRLKGTANVVSYEDHMVIAGEREIGWDVLIRMELLNAIVPYAYGHPFSRRDVIKLGIDICKALELCQKYNIIHRDIKPENIFVSNNGDYKLGDFGIARTIEKTTAGLSKKGTYTYMAPEVYKGHEYGFNVDIYSLGIVLYRFLNRNRAPFYPPPSEKITPSVKEQALVRRMNGEPLPKPYFAQGRLGEIVLKACAYNPAERYSSPKQMREELEAILYDEKDASLIYPYGDTLVLEQNKYASQDVPSKPDQEDVKTERATGRQNASRDFTQREITQAAAEPQRYPLPNIDQTVASDVGQYQEEHRKQRKKPKVWPMLLGMLLFLSAVPVYFVYRTTQYQERLRQYQSLMDNGTALCETMPDEALELFERAQSLEPGDASAYVSYAYTLFCAGRYEQCVAYIEDDLAMGKEFDIDAQSQLSEILGAAYFEQEEYTAAASFFRLSAAGGDMGVSAMRDYAVSLGRIGDIEAAEEVLQEIIDSGAANDVTTYVKAEVDYAQEEYSEAEAGFREVLDTTEETILQRRSVRSLAEVYRDCTSLDKLGQSPIDNPAEKEIDLLAANMSQYGLMSDTTLWEMLGMAYYEASQMSDIEENNYLENAAQCFQRVVEMGITTDYLYLDLYTVYYQLGDYEAAGGVLDQFEDIYPSQYLPHALRGVLLITIENEKEANERDYSEAVLEYETAESLCKNTDDATYLQQLGSLVAQLSEEGWL
jgi:serine/threonine protein kinase